MSGLENQQKLRIIWCNGNSHRYVPLAYDIGSSGWGVYDRADGTFVDDKMLDEIDPNEPLVKS